MKIDKWLTTYLLILVCLTSSCNTYKSTGLSEKYSARSNFTSAFTGVVIVHAKSGEMVFGVNENLHFTPASNTKLLTTYAVLSHMQDSLIGWKYLDANDTLYIYPQGDPTFLHPDFKEQAFFDFLKGQNKPISLVLDPSERVNRFGSGWSWSTWLNTYSPERSKMPIYGNLVRVKLNGSEIAKVSPSYFSFKSSEGLSGNVFLNRPEHSNVFFLQKAERNSLVRPFTLSNNDSLMYNLLKDTLENSGFLHAISLTHKSSDQQILKDFPTAPIDSVLQLMMHRSDNFIAEQLLLMVSKRKYGKFNETRIRKDILEKDLSAVVQNGRWADGSGLSKSNLFTPYDFVRLIEELDLRYGEKRIQSILPHGNTGTLTGLYKDYPNQIWAKTGTLLDHLGLSGILHSKKGEKYYFSILINNHRGSALSYRKDIEAFLIDFIENH